jgi:16S rRNA (uracil1498-N3)-methyltransferase
MPRFFVDSEQIGENEIVITGSDVNHIKNVLRMSVGEELTISDGHGMDYFCKIGTLERDEVVAEIIDSWHSFVELPVKIYLFQGMPKSDKMELIIQKAVELGVYEIIPVITKRTVVRLDEKKEQKKQTRWQSIAESAAKQAGRALIPEVAASMSFEKALHMCNRLDAVLIPYEKAEGMRSARELVHAMHGRQSIGIFIGPEGGFEESEIEAAKAAGAVPMTLGRRILRTETAGLTMLSILMFELEED